MISFILPTTVTPAAEFLGFQPPWPPYCPHIDAIPVALLGIAALIFQIHYRDDAIKGTCGVMVRVCGVERVMVIAASL